MSKYITVRMSGPGYDRALEVDARDTIARRRWLGELSPEPEAVEWINSFSKGDIFFDVGANVGTHTARACLRGAVVYAFEPVRYHYAQLVSNLRDNALEASCYMVAMMDVVTFGDMGPGRSSHHYTPRAGVRIEGTVSSTIDIFSNVTSRVPDHIKIDVDGNDFYVLVGAFHTLNKVKSVFIELDPKIAHHNDVPQYLKDRGFTWDEKQVEACRIKSGKYEGMANWIFYK